MPKVKKSIEIADAKISFLSLVDKAANQWQWLVTKNQDGQSGFKYDKPILKHEDEEGKHYVVGVVYEPLVADYHDNFMTEEEIAKACEWFNDNGLGSDLQHNENIQVGVNIVKSWVTEEDTTINGQEIKKGTWLAKAEVTDETLWNQIEKGEITGWSMGGVGNYSVEDVNLEEVQKSVVNKILDSIKKAFNLDSEEKLINKGQMTDKYNKQMKQDGFWNAFWTLESVLNPYINDWAYERSFETDPTVIKEALTEFNEILTHVLTSGEEDITKALTLPINKAGKKISAANLEKIKSAHTALDEIIQLAEEVNQIEEDEEMKQEDITKIAQEVVKMMKPEPAGTVVPEVALTDDEKIQKSVTEVMGKMLEPVKKHLGLETEPETLESKIAKAVGVAMEDIYQTLGVSKQLDSEEEIDEVVVKGKNQPVFKGIFGSTR